MYVVLLENKTEDGSTFSMLGKFEASTGGDACRRAARDRDEAGVYYAVPAKSWSPHALRIETEKRVLTDSPAPVMPGSPPISA